MTFFQVSLSAAKTLCDAVLAGLGDDISEWRVVDAFCGAGTFTLPLAQRAKRVIGIEEYAPAVASGQQNAWTNGLENVEWYTEPVERGIAHVLEADAIVLDPPRRGCHPETIMGILRLMPKKVVYVSCHPGTLARDLQLIVAGGYKVTAITCVDCFPQTAHVESVTVLERI
jgi:23S rRNA (uracil1939-C5)-methyltransferase